MRRHQMIRMRGWRSQLNKVERNKKNRLKNRTTDGRQERDNKGSDGNRGSKRRKSQFFSKDFEESLHSQILGLKAKESETVAQSRRYSGKNILKKSNVPSISNVLHEIDNIGPDSKKEESSSRLKRKQKSHGKA
jgi:hypothetical protein